MRQKPLVRAVFTMVIPVLFCVAVPLRAEEAPAVFTLPGAFFAATPSTPTFGVDMHPPAGSYASVHLAMDVMIPSWNAEKPKGLHNLFWLVRAKRNFYLYGYGNIHGSVDPPKAQLMMRHGVGMHVAQKPKAVRAHARIPLNAIYHIDYVFEAGKTARMTVTDSQARIVGYVENAAAEVPDVVVDRKGWFVGFGVDPRTEDNPNAVPGYGWQYMNLIVAWLK